MKPWIRRVLGLPEGSQTLQTGQALDDYVIVKKRDLDGLLAELEELRKLKKALE